tara:strand:+ start:347 stop:526 length:180 start_codon:yes stop_codon:yes gene_type:complete
MIYGMIRNWVLGQLRWRDLIFFTLGLSLMFYLKEQTVVNWEPVDQAQIDNAVILALHGN